MTDQFKFIVAKSGFAYSDPDVRNLLFHSDYKLLKQYAELSGTLSFTHGETSKTLTLNHNLGYVPAYIPYLHWPDFYDQTEKYYLLPFYASGIFGDLAIDTFVDSTKVQLNVLTPDIYTTYYPSMFDFTDVYSNYDEFDLIFGNDGNGRDGAIRFYNVALNQNQSIESASIDFWISEKGSSTSDAKLQCWGIDEDDCGDIYFNLGRDKTTARTTQNVSASANAYFGIDVTDQVREIIGRGGWQNGNHMGFYIFNDGSPSNAWRKDTEYKTFLKIVLSGSYTMYFKAVVFLDKIL